MVDHARTKTVATARAAVADARQAGSHVERRTGDGMTIRLDNLFRVCFYIPVAVSSLCFLFCFWVSGCLFVCLFIWFGFDVCVRFQRQLPVVPVVPVVRHDEDEPSDVDSYEHDDADASEARKRDRVARLIDDGASVDGDASDDEEDPAGVDAYEEEDASLAGEEEDGVVLADEYRRRQRHSAKRSHAAMERHVESLPRNVQGYQEVRFSFVFFSCVFVC